ncbi:MAG: glycosyltransferase [Anaerolineales bacterium]|nr:MAG: glycosyltransferase [Anaerolineales bacterium]
MQAFAEKPGYQVTLISPYGSPSQAKDICGVKLITMQPPSRSQAAAKRASRVVFNWARLRQIIRKENFDIVHIHQLPPPTAAFFFGGISRLVVSIWGSDILNFEGNPRHILFNSSRRFILRQADAVVALSKYLATAARSYLPQDRPIHVIPFGIDWPQFTDLSISRPLPTPIRLVITKHLEPIYGHYYLFQALRIVVDQYKSIELIIAGEGSLRTELEELANRLNLKDKISFFGRIEPEKIKLLLYQSHIFVMPSLSESLGVAALEAQATGLPVIATNVGGIPEAVLDGETGLLVPPRNISALASAISRLVKDNKLRIKMGNAGQAFVRKHYSWDDSVNNMSLLYQQVISRSP